MITYLKKRNILAVLFLPLVTCGIYSLVWYFTAISEMNDELKRIFPEESTISPIKAILLSMVTCGIYGIFAYYTWAKNIEKLGSYYQVSTTEPVVILLVVFFFGPAVPLLLQNDLNKMVDKVDAYQKAQYYQQQSQQ